MIDPNLCYQIYKNLYFTCFILIQWTYITWHKSKLQENSFPLNGEYAS